MSNVESNAAAIIERYCDVMALRETATDELGKAEWQGVAKRLREAWREWQGKDSLHEMAFGEPAE
ncbi:MAG TPA: hypothetical protein VGP76_05835 [Planctomycetaceae bacterium]|jgi:hypothetical protein|nr:hypothetical protein [Planctomycetaceae bacterium]